MLWLGQGLQRKPRGGNLFRAAYCSAGRHRQFGKPGAGFFYLNGRRRGKGVDCAIPMAPELRRAPGATSAISTCRKAGKRPQRERAPSFTWNINILAFNPDQARLRCALPVE